MNLYFTIKNKYGVRELLQFIEANKGIDTLEVHMAPDGNQSDVILVLEKKIAS